MSVEKLNVVENENTPKPKLDDRFLQSIKGKDFVVYAGLLDLAHQHGLQKLEVETVQIPTKENGNMAICRAVATTKNGEVFSDIGDANPNNVTSMIIPHLFRMSSTRAKSRVLRDLCNIGMTCLEELGDMDEVINDQNHSTKPATQKRKNSKPSPSEKRSNSKSATKKNQPPPTEKDSTAPMSEAQKRAVQNLSALTHIFCYRSPVVASL